MNDKIKLQAFRLDDPRVELLEGQTIQTKSKEPLTEEKEETLDQNSQVQPEEKSDKDIHPLPSRKTWPWPLALGFGLLGLFIMVLVGDAWLTLANAYNNNFLLGTITAFFLLLVVASLAVFILQEGRSLRYYTARKETKQHVHTQIQSGNEQNITKALARLEKQLSKHEELRWSLGRYKEQMPNANYSAQERLALFEREILAPLDNNAMALIEHHARMSALVTSISPFALIDMLVTLWRNMRLIREIAQVYGTRLSYLSSVRLMSQVTKTVLLSGSLEAADGLIHQMLGSGLVGRLSTKMGQGLVNGLFTARLGLAAMEQARPLGFIHIKRPGLSAVAKALTASVKRSFKGKESE